MHSTVPKLTVMYISHMCRGDDAGDVLYPLPEGNDSSLESVKSHMAQLRTRTIRSISGSFGSSSGGGAAAGIGTGSAAAMQGGVGMHQMGDSAHGASYGHAYGSSGGAGAMDHQHTASAGAPHFALGFGHVFGQTAPGHQQQQQNQQVWQLCDALLADASIAPALKHQAAALREMLAGSSSALTTY